MFPAIFTDADNSFEVFARSYDQVNPLCAEQAGQASTMWRLFLLIPRRHPDNETNEAVTDAADEKAIDIVMWNDPCAGRIKRFQAN